MASRSSHLVTSSVTMNNTPRTFPSAIATYEDVVANKNLFMTTLKKLHSDLGTDFWIPSVRSKTLDLHHLFVAVTSRGGIEQIVRERRWEEVMDTFEFSTSYKTNIVSNIVRREYYSLLHDYEIIYFFKARNQFPPLTGFVYGRNESGYLVTFAMGSWRLEGVLYESREKSVTQDSMKQSYGIFPNTWTDTSNPRRLLKTKNVPWYNANKQQQKEVIIIDPVSPKQNTEADAPVEESQAKESKHSDSESKQRSPQAKTATPMEKASDLVNKSMVGVRVNGVLDGKLDNGYLVTVKIGTQELKGFLYPLPLPPVNKYDKKVYVEKGKNTHPFKP